MDSLKFHLIIVLLGSLVISCNSQTSPTYPVEDFVVIQSEVDGYPIFGIVNKGYKDYSQKEKYPWVLVIDVKLDSVNRDELPTNQEAEAQNKLEDEIIELLSSEIVIHYIGRTAYRGYRTIYFYLKDPETANKILSKEVQKEEHIRLWAFHMEMDPTWKEVNLLFKAK